MTKGMNFAAALFDFDGTVVDSRHATVLAVQQTFTAYALPEPTPESVIDLMGVPIEKIFPYLGGQAYQHDKHIEMIAHFRGLCIPLNAAHTFVYDGMPEMLADLKAASVPCAVVSSKRSPLIHTTYGHTGLDGLFAVTVGSDHVTDHKPHPAPALLALAQLGVAPSKKCVMVGDATVDIATGKAAGLTTIAVTWGAQNADKLASADPDHIVHNRADLRRLLLG